MRVLVSSPSAAGHLGPVLLLASAVRDDGNTVRVVVPEEVAERVRRRALDVGIVPPPSNRLASAWQDLVGRVEALMAAGHREQGDRLFVREGFGRLHCEAAFETLQAEVDDFEPDLVLTDAFHSPAVAAAALAEVPIALAAFGVWQPLSDLLPEVAAGAAPVVAPFGPTVRELLETWRQAPRFSPLPAMFDIDTARVGDESPAFIRWRRPEHAGPDIPDDLRRSLDGDSRPLVYATLGTVAGSIPPMRDRFLGGLLPAIADLDVRCVLTVGRQTDLDALPPVPTNVTVAPFLPQRPLLERAALAVSHGGLNTVLDISQARVPHVVIPLHSYDGHVNAHRIQALGAGRAVTGPHLTPEHVGGVVDAVLGDTAVEAAVHRLADAIEQLPDLAHAVRHLELLSTSE